MSDDTAPIEIATCPDCKGKKRMFAHINRGEGGKHDFRHIDCIRCKGSGFVPAVQLVWLEEGRKMRAERQARDMSLMEEAKRRGISSAELSAMETGRSAPRRGESR